MKGRTKRSIQRRNIERTKEEWKGCKKGGKRRNESKTEGMKKRRKDKKGLQEKKEQRNKKIEEGKERKAGK